MEGYAYDPTLRYEEPLNIVGTALLAAGPTSAPGTTIYRQTGSSQQAVHFTTQGLAAGAGYAQGRPGPARTAGSVDGSDRRATRPLGAEHVRRSFRGWFSETPLVHRQRLLPGTVLMLQRL
jgi:hypothetical protein